MILLLPLEDGFCFLPFLEIEERRLRLLLRGLELELHVMDTGSDLALSWTISQLNEPLHPVVVDDDVETDTVSSSD